jgi:hypothetical protein
MEKIVEETIEKTVRLSKKDWEDNVINLILKASFPETVDELEIIMWRIEDLLIERGIVRITAA